jgi:hypothetical protein
VATLPGVRQIEQVFARPDYWLCVTWTDGQRLNIDLSHDVTAAGVWQSLADPALFQDVRIAANKCAIEWPNPSDDEGEPMIDIDSEGLHWLAVNQIKSQVAESLVEKAAP